jgi:hypothetical protein
MADDRVARPVAKRHKTSHYFPNGTPFWDRVDKSGGPDACWPWMAGRTPQGYGSLQFDGKRIYAHRYAYECKNGPLSQGAFVLHSCDNPPCCNPRHLREGGPKENIKDAIERDRIAHSERHGQTKFSDDTIRAMLAAWRAGEGTRYAVAKRFNMSPANFRRITDGIARTYLKE